MGDITTAVEVGGAVPSAAPHAAADGMVVERRGVALGRGNFIGLAKGKRDCCPGFDEVRRRSRFNEGGNAAFDDAKLGGLPSSSTNGARPLSTIVLLLVREWYPPPAAPGGALLLM